MCRQRTQAAERRWVWQVLKIKIKAPWQVLFLSKKLD
jgi:hypothetical protein